MVGIISPTGSIWTKSLATFGILVAAELLPGTATAAAIRHVAASNARVSHSWSAYLQASPSVWRTVHAPTFTPAVRSMIWRELRQGGDPSALPMINYLTWRWSLNPQRFTHYHPRLGAAIERLANQPTVTVPETITPTPTPTPPLIPPSPQTVDPNVPEPSTILMAMLIGAWGVCSRRRLQLLMGNQHR